MQTRPRDAILERMGLANVCKLAWSNDQKTAEWIFIQCDMGSPQKSAETFQF